MPLLQDSEVIRENLLSRNLYTPDNPYEIDNPKLVDAINSIAKIVSPTKSIDIRNTVIGRVVGPNTPIAQIGIEQLAKQFGQSFVQRSLINIMPSISFSNLFDGNPNTKLFTKKSDYRITIDDDDNKIEDFIKRVSGVKPISIPYTLSSSKNQYTTSFDSSVDNSTLIRNTGKGVLNFYYDSLNRSLYKKSDRPFLSTTSSKNFEIIPAGAEWFSRIYFSETDTDIYPSTIISGIVNKQFRQKQTEDLQFASNDDRPFEYGSESYKLRLGTHKKSTKESAINLANSNKSNDFEFVYGTDGFSNENPDNQIIWGTEDAFLDIDAIDTKFGVRSGMLGYTRALLQVRGGNSSMNQTNKKWFDKEGNPMYNGSPLTRDNNGAQRTERQHSIIDPYNTFKKAIRFDGNGNSDINYKGPIDSVIHKYVIPKMHPIFDSEKNALDNRNMMFSLENLAFRLNSEGYIGDNYGTKVPKSEVGQHRGRIMWFPPYGITLSESALAKYESTALIGRGEPIYSFSNSERIARLSFKLIIDYPPQIRGKNHAEISKFFAFGGDELANMDINQLEAMNKTYDAELAKLVPKKIQETIVPSTTNGLCTFYFPNDIPLEFTEGRSIIDNIIIDKYETGDGVDGIDGISDNGYNKNYYDTVLDFVSTKLKVADPKDWSLIKLIFKGSATKLNQKAKNYNLKLSQRRVQSVREYVEDVFWSVYGKKFDEAGITWEDDPEGDVKGTPKGSFAANMNDADVKLERMASVTMTYSGKNTIKEVGLTPDEVESRKTIEEMKNANDNLIREALEYQNHGTLFRLRNKEDKTVTGYDDVTKRYLSPVFHSQTPEDFHRRLTFLQQCTRQGNATINQSTLDDGISVSRNSVFGRPPICVLRIGDFFHTKVVIDSVDFDYADAPWDMNPEGMGMQFMIATIDITMRLIGGQSLKAPIDVIQNGNSFNYYANSTYYATDVYATARKMENIQTKADSAALTKTSIAIVKDKNYPSSLDNSDTIATSK